eukprot:TRINITY_DN24642_c0_g1_i1.p2 TRINITY_DN24642_c0_g1~~TRINITY_DN24642_c0_g1_i1.p2  ORF type:complete len:384 (+),score=88.93 TRINITY_DN24642_c0_g1_i1:58-1209(+)
MAGLGVLSVWRRLSVQQRWIAAPLAAAAAVQVCRTLRSCRRQQQPLRRLHDSGCFSYAGCLRRDECEKLCSALLPGLVRKGRRELRWYGALWQDGRQPIVSTVPIPSQVSAIVDAAARRCGWTRSPNVATIHRYLRSDAQRGQGVLRGRAVAIPPHIDDPRLAGAERGVILLQLAGASDVLLMGARLEVVAERDAGTAVVIRGAAFSDYRHAVLWPEGHEDRAAEMITLTLRVIDGVQEATGPRPRAGGRRPLQSRALAMPSALWRQVMAFASAASALQFWRSIPRTCPAGGAAMQWWREGGSAVPVCSAAFGQSISDVALPRAPADALRSERRSWALLGANVSAAHPGCSRCGAAGQPLSPAGVYRCADCGASSQWGQLAGE